MIDAAALSGHLAATLIPALPYLLAKVDAGALAQAGQKLGADAWKLARGFRGALEPTTQADPAAQQLTAQVAEDPSQSGAAAALGFQLQALFKTDPALAAELTRILESSAHARASTTVTASGEHSVAAWFGVPASI